MNNQNNQLQVFKNEEMNLKARTIQNEDGSISINAEDTAIGFGFTQNKKGKIYIRWETINNYIKGLGFSQQVGKDDFIPESLFYMLGMKANNDKAKRFQQWLAVDVIPNIRKHGGYLTPEKVEEVLLNPDTIIKLATQLKEEQNKNKLLNNENNALSKDIITWADTSIINALIRKYGANIKNDFGGAWIEFKKCLLYKYSINLNSRMTNYLNNTTKKTKPKTLSMLKNKEELTMALKTAISMCRDEGIDISGILGKHLKDEDLNKII
ncbi:BRO domain-containing protein [Clostridium botulinum B str. Osaka05]|uniref:BRO domain-containing protein n=1 Tax=Clostridium botulinum B str. Osaka05 TaxID=1407017 RepID=A0A060N4Z1_CLOBO|nr:BRO family protein [Clostridium botulinum]BAO04912.1 BRO domain-containing protein [Clostridium botulinum B str. Osaka05]